MGTRADLCDSKGFSESQNETEDAGLVLDKDRQLDGRDSAFIMLIFLVMTSFLTQ